MTGDEIARFRWTLLSMFRRAESTFIQTELGTLESESWAGINATLQLGLATRQGALWWDETADRFNPRFRDDVNSSVRAPGFAADRGVRPARTPRNARRARRMGSSLP